MNKLSEKDRAYIWHPFTSLGDNATPLIITKGEGIYLHTHDGRKILDAVSSWWVNLHGHGNPYIAKAVAEQAFKLEHVIFAGFTHEPAIRLSENLLSILPEGQSKVFFSDDGSTAVEVGLKMAFQYWHNQSLNKNKVIAIAGAYHGDTFGSMSVGDRGTFTAPFRSHLFETDFIDFPKEENRFDILNHFKKLVDSEDVAAFIFEPLLQGAAGMRMYSAEFLDDLIEYAQAKDVICIADEVLTGFGRTGKLFASDYLRYKPDIVALSKGLTGGVLPLGVTTCNQKILSAFQTEDVTKTFFHGHSYTANPIACAAANASFELLVNPQCQENIQRISDKHRKFREEIRDHHRITEVRSLGTIMALELRTDENSNYMNSIRKKIYSSFLDRNILLRPLGNVIYILPPYIIQDEELEFIYRSISEFLKEV
jgi:adenosylmethionine-8-amino-7-oxononanoate aminotransferase